MRDIKFTILLFLIVLIGLINIIWLARLQVTIYKTSDLGPVKKGIETNENRINNINQRLETLALKDSMNEHYILTKELVIGDPNSKSLVFINNAGVKLIDPNGNETLLLPTGIITLNEPVTNYATKKELGRILSLINVVDINDLPAETEKHPLSTGPD